MELTPIHIPGKRRRKGEPPPPPPKSKRPRKGGENKALVKASKEPSRKGSYIENMPLEILERIFFHAENVNLARASPLIGSMLSGISTRRWVFIQAFAPTWCREGIYKENLLDWDPNPAHQSALLEYSWADMRFIAECFEQCVRQYPDIMASHDIFGDLVDDEEDGNGNGVAGVAAPEEADENGVEENGAQETEVTTAERCFLRHYAAFRGGGRAVDAALLTRSDLVTMVEARTRIPDALLAGPWDEEALKKLYWLVRACARVQEDQTWELTYPGFRLAVEGGLSDDGFGMSALALFKHLGVWLSWPPHVLGEAYELVYPLELKAAWTKGNSVSTLYGGITRQLGNAIAAAKGSQAMATSS
ncbi:hypothetical protein DL766_000431 [Monosporascus sp. MC13-8B]|uniref:F-box domain-containing protein n=1 Tax=Monosporascus cannonballus TaxID=155416 RepID=A0ABY0HCP5_9PEZI|nr:hypothetical protein DL762_003142 [Monosporascus cannonballus]RYO98996.1 hypothetical protein DL763_001801 [Monosporascus cannonballus]RYP39406.1 hypothetical protein DL766_000431 [Monosporascus sp. MC13-8B]